MPARLLPQARLGLLEVTLRGPRMGGAARHVAVAEVSRSGSAVLQSELELGCSLVVETRGSL